MFVPRKIHIDHSDALRFCHQIHYLTVEVDYRSFTAILIGPNSVGWANAEQNDQFELLTNELDCIRSWFENLPHLRSRKLHLKVWREKFKRIKQASATCTQTRSCDSNYSIILSLNDGSVCSSEDQWDAIIVLKLNDDSLEEAVAPFFSLPVWHRRIADT